MRDLRRTIIDTAVELVATEGVRGVSFREVARRAGVSHQAPYHHFGNLHGILEAITREGFTHLTTAMREAAESASDDPLQALTDSGVAYVRFAIDHLGYFRVMFQRSLVDLHDAHSPIGEADDTHGLLVRLAETAHAAGYGAHLPVEVLTLLCWSTVHGLAILLVEGVLAQKADLGGHERDVLIAHVVESLGGLLSQPSRQ